MPQTTSNHTDHHGLLAIFKGESGEGKSVAALSFPNEYVFDFDRKMPSIAQKHFPGKEIHWDTFESIFDIDKRLTELFDNCPYETLVVDSITGLVNIVMDSVGQVKKETVTDILSRVSSKSNTIEMMGIDYYSAEDRFCTYFVDRLKTLWARPDNPKNVIIIAHVVTVESAPDLKTKYVTKTRSIVSKGKKFAAWLPTGFDNVYIFGRQFPDLGDIDQTVKRVALTEAFGEDSAKCSYPFPKSIEFTNGSFYDKISKYVDLKGTPKLSTVAGVIDAEFVEIPK
jgi:AAA domain-containing protein